MKGEQAFGFFGVSPLETRLYLRLLQAGVVNGSELARLESLTRASVYSALNNLAEKGLVRVIPGQPQQFEATPYKQLIRRFEQLSKESIKEIEQTLESLPQPTSTLHVINFSDRDYFDVELIERLQAAKREVYISACRDLQFLESTLLTLARRKVRVIGFTFSGDSPTGLCGLKKFPSGEIYVRPSLPLVHNASERVMAVVDLEYALSGGYSAGGGFLGIASANKLFVNMTAEHIHHDIYLAKMETLSGRDPVGSSILIGSLHETSGK